MDKFIYIAAGAAKNAMARQDNVAHNLANANTSAFKTQLIAFRSAPVQGEGMPSRAFAVESTTGVDFSPGPMNPTGRKFDLAITGNGFFTVRNSDGKEAYTREGSLHLDPQGNIVNSRGFAMLGEGGPLIVPPAHDISIEGDGTITAIPLTGNLNNIVQVGKLKLVNPDAKTMIRSDDGLFRLRSGQNAQPDPTATVQFGMLEGSNVNVAESMAQMISAARFFDMQLKLISTAERNAQAANQLLTMQ